MTVFSHFDGPWDGQCDSSGVGYLSPSPPCLVSSLNNPISHLSPISSSHAHLFPTLCPFGLPSSLFSRFSPPLPSSPLHSLTPFQSHSHSKVPLQTCTSSIIKDINNLSSKDFHPLLGHSFISHKVASLHSFPDSAPSDFFSAHDPPVSSYTEPPPASNSPSIPSSSSSILPSSRPRSLLPRCRGLPAHSPPSNPFHPPVPAALRLATWSSPYDLRTWVLMASTHPPSVVNDAYSLVADSLSANTRSTYTAGVKCFIEFCDEKGISEDARMPVSTIMLTAFVKWASG
ncbi:hypothetical protein CVT25_004379 [Psilocybe cyanescens]|uniref:Uncharacterized protein n=1 Tax=Psilocybe cyanescens TaxID=93625 RepID=A0A409XVW7_PSICY|nr:hypothetical protein CVT25_004379 [Psilocybe cyanescens]